MALRKSSGQEINCGFQSNPSWRVYHGVRAVRELLRVQTLRHRWRQGSERSLRSDPPLRLRGRTGVFRRRECHLLAGPPRASLSASHSCSWLFASRAEGRRLRSFHPKGFSRPRSSSPSLIALCMFSSLRLSSSRWSGTGAVGRVSRLRVEYVHIYSTAKEFLFHSFGGVVSMTVHFPLRCCYMEGFLKGC